MNKPEKLTRQTPDARALNMEALRQLLPECFAEVRDPNTGAVSHALDWDALRQALGDNAVEERDEMYQFTWPGKNDARREAAQPTTQTLRPLPQEGESRDWATTQNVYIEGDNLQVLKLLQRGYMGRVKMIYIDPPYNTGNDFVYHDDFRRTAAEEDLAAGNTDEQGNRFRKNLGTNGRFHSDWCSMIYARLLACRSLLTEDGVIFISIDDNEVANLKKICDEVFGEGNYRNTLLTRRRIKSLNTQFSENGLKTLNVGFEYILVYAKQDFLMKAIRQKKAEAKEGQWQGFWSNADRPTMRYEVLGFTPTTGQWRSSKEKALQAVENYKLFADKFSNEMSLEEYSSQTGITTFIKRDLNGKGQNGGVYHWVPPTDSVMRTSNWTDIEVSQIGKEIKLPFDNPKSKRLIMELIRLTEFSDTDLILDFFSGSATTAHAVMQLNAEDGGHRKYICVQLPEETAEDSEARKAGYQNICEIGKERIRRAGAKIREASPLTTQGLDTGFRVFRLAESNFENVSRQPKDYAQDELDLFADNIRQGRTDMDLLFGAMLMMGVPEPLSQPVETLAADGKQIYDVAGGALVACFAEGVSEATVAAIAARRPLRVLFRDSCFKTDAEKINIFEQFKQAMDWTDAEAVKKIQVL